MDCTNPRPTRRWLGGTSEGLAVDRLGIDVDQWHNARTHRMPSTRDECEQYPLSSHEATRSESGGDSKRAGTEPRASIEQVEHCPSYPYPALRALLPRAHMPPPQRLYGLPYRSVFRLARMLLRRVRGHLRLRFVPAWARIYGTACRCSLAYIIFVIWFRFSEGKKFDDDGRRKPEERFVPLMVGCVFIPLSLFSFGWSARNDIHWIVPIIGSGLFSLGSFSLFVSLVGQYLG
jgi:hypothetical protein